MKQWRCEDGHITTCEEQPRECTHTARGYTMRAPDALVVPPTCGKPVFRLPHPVSRVPPPIGGQPKIVGMVVDCYGCGKLTANAWYCDDCWSDKQGGYSDG